MSMNKYLVATLLVGLFVVAGCCCNNCEKKSSCGCSCGLSTGAKEKTTGSADIETCVRKDVIDSKTPNVENAVK